MLQNVLLPFPESGAWNHMEATPSAKDIESNTDQQGQGSNTVYPWKESAESLFILKSE